PKRRCYLSERISSLLLNNIVKQRGKNLAISRCLNAVKLRILARFRHQLFMASRLHYACSVQNNNEVGHAHSAETVRDKDRNAALGVVLARCGGESFEQGVLGFGIKRRRRFIQNKQ